MLLGSLLPMGTAPGQDITALRDIASRRRHTRAEQKKVEAWVAAQLATLTDADAPDAPARFRATFDRLTRSAPPIKVTPKFIDLLAAKCSKLFPAALANVRSDEALLALAIVLARIPSAAAADGLVACLEHANMGVRYWGAEGLRRDRAYLLEENEAQVARRVVAALGKAGGREINGIVLRKIYPALDFAAAGDSVPAALVQEIVTACETVVEGRIKAYQARRTGAIVADAEAPRMLVSLWLYDKTPDTEKRRLLGLVSRLLQASTVLFAEGPAASQTDLLPVIAACEGALRRVCVKSEFKKSLPQVAPLLKGGSPQQVQLEALKWTGSKDVQGVLNGPPFNVPVPPAFILDDAGTPAAEAAGGGGGK